MRSMTVATALFAAITGIAVPGAYAAEQEARPGPTVVIRDSGVTEKSFVPPRRLESPLPKVQTSTFQVTYNGFSSEAQNAFQAAVDVLSELFVSPVTIRVEANWESLDEDVLGSAGANFIWRDFPGAPEPGAFYVDALADAIRGSDIGGGDFDVLATFNSDFPAWYFGTDGNTPFNQSDFMSVVLHELCHGLGFIGSAEVNNGVGSWGVSSQGQIFPVIYDVFMEDGSGTPITDIPNSSTVLGETLQSNNLFWGGPQAVSVNGGVRPRMYAPSSWEPGSSYSHLNETTYPAGNMNSLMTPRISRGEAIHDPGPISLCLSQDMGWETTETCGAGASTNLWVATAARASGAQGSQWRTTLGVFNPSTATATVDVSYHRTGGSTSAASLSIPSGAQALIDDVVGFLGSAGSGPLEIDATQPVIVGSRTFNQSNDGTFGQYLDGVAPENGASSGQSVWLAMLRENTDFRSNIGFTNTGISAAVVAVTLYDGTGAQVTSFSVTIPAGSNKQENQPFLNRGGRNDIGSGTAKVSVTAGSGLLIYGSVIDNLTGDPTTIPPK